MPASLRTQVSRATLSRPYDRHSPTAAGSPEHSERPLVQVHPPLFPRVLPVSPIHHQPEPYLEPSHPSYSDPDPGPDPDAEEEIPSNHPGLPTYDEYKRIEADYLRGLSPRKRDKALITQAMFDKIWDVLHQPEACTIETPQFRFWVRKMFTLTRPTEATITGAGIGTWDAGRHAGWRRAGGYADSDSDSEEADLELERAMGIGRDASTSDLLITAVVLHENRPVAIREQLYELFCYCHVRAGHGGRDKTCAVIRQHYSWVPKELTAQFVKACPTCALKRSGHAGASMSVGIDVGLARRRAIAQREKRGRARVEETSVSVVPSSLGHSMVWPTTGGPLDPANPPPCGLREREREREWLRAQEVASATLGPSSPTSSPADSARMWSIPTEVPLESWSPSGQSSIVPRALTSDASPFPPCDTTHSLGSPRPFAVELKHRNRIRSDNREEICSPTKTTELPSLASALSNESLDDNVNLTGLEPELCRDAAMGAGEGLPPVLRPLRLLGPVTVPCADTSPDLPAFTSSLFQIDPVLLSLDYPGLSMPGASESSGSGLMSCLGLSMSASTGMETLPSLLDAEQTHVPLRSHLRPTCVVVPDIVPGEPGLYDRLRALSSEGMGADVVDVDSESMCALATPDLDWSRSTVNSTQDSPDLSSWPWCARHAFTLLDG